jgi:hypothetical protein
MALVVLPGQVVMTINYLELAVGSCADTANDARDSGHKYAGDRKKQSWDHGAHSVVLPR